MSPAKLLEISCSEKDRWESKPLHEAVVEQCRELGVAGATVLRGLEGYGETAAIHSPHLLRHDLPVTILVVDSAEKVETLARVVQRMMEKGIMTISDVSARRVRTS